MHHSQTNENGYIDPLEMPSSFIVGKTSPSIFTTFYSEVYY